MRSGRTRAADPVSALFRGAALDWSRPAAAADPLFAERPTLWSGVRRGRCDRPAAGSKPSGPASRETAFELEGIATSCEMPNCSTRPTPSARRRCICGSRLGQRPEPDPAASAAARPLGRRELDRDVCDQMVSSRSPGTDRRSQPRHRRGEAAARRSAEKASGSAVLPAGDDRRLQLRRDERGAAWAIAESRPRTPPRRPAGRPVEAASRPERIHGGRNDRPASSALVSPVYCRRVYGGFRPRRRRLTGDPSRSVGVPPGSGPT